MVAWEAPAHWQRITTIDAHAAGEPLRVICSGFPHAGRHDHPRGVASRPAGSMTTCAAA